MGSEHVTTYWTEPAHWEDPLRAAIRSWLDPSYIDNDVDFVFDVFAAEHTYKQTSKYISRFSILLPGATQIVAMRRTDLAVQPGDYQPITSHPMGIGYMADVAYILLDNLDFALMQLDTRDQVERDILDPVIAVFRHELAALRFPCTEEAEFVGMNLYLPRTLTCDACPKRLACLTKGWPMNMTTP